LEVEDVHGPLLVVRDAAEAVTRSRFRSHLRYWNEYLLLLTGGYSIGIVGYGLLVVVKETSLSYFWLVPILLAVILLIAAIGWPSYRVLRLGGTQYSYQPRRETSPVGGDPIDADKPRPVGTLLLYGVLAGLIAYTSPLNRLVGWAHDLWVLLVAVAIASVVMALVLRVVLVVLRRRDGR
jgi:hypothetical protein